MQACQYFGFHLPLEIKQNHIKEAKGRSNSCIQIPLLSKSSQKISCFHLDSYLLSTIQTFIIISVSLKFLHKKQKLTKKPKQIKQNLFFDMQMCFSFAPLRSYVSLLFKMSSNFLPAGSVGFTPIFQSYSKPLIA